MVAFAVPKRRDRAPRLPRRWSRFRYDLDASRFESLEGARFRSNTGSSANWVCIVGHSIASRLNSNQAAQIDADSTRKRGFFRVAKFPFRIERPGQLTVRLTGVLRLEKILTQENQLVAFDENDRVGVRALGHAGGLWARME